MHLLYVGINYAPEETSVGPFATGLCEHLVERGNRVSVITAFPYYPQWRIYDGYRGSLGACKTIGGVSVRRVIHFVPSRPRDLVQRLLHDVTFSFNAMLATSLVGPVDGILCSSPPPFVSLASWLVGRLRGVPFALNLTDLSADAAISLGIIGKRGNLVRWATALENFNYRHAVGIGVLCPAFKHNLMRRGVPADKISIVPTWADTEFIRPLPRENLFRTQSGLAGNFVALHTGNMGLKQGLQTVVEAARASNSDVKWMLVGDGEERAKLLEMSQKYALNNLCFLPVQPKAVFPYVLAAADVLLLLQKATVTDSVTPSKLLAYMAAGRPIVVSAHRDSEAVRSVRDADCGVIVPPEDPQSLRQAVERMRAMPEEAERLGAHGRAYVEEHFAKEAVLEMYDRFLAKTFPGFEPA